MEEDIKKSDKSSNSSYYFAVFIPQDVRGQMENVNESLEHWAIFDSLQPAIELVKKFKDNGARFKSFADLEEAKKYVKDGPPGSQSGVKGQSENDNNGVSVRVDLPAVDSPKIRAQTVGDEKSFPFPAPSRPELNLFRKAIEQFDDDFVQWAVFDNPRYLINCNSDSPTVLFEGCRYNAMHIAAKSGNLRVCELILQLFGTNNSDYVKMLYVDDTEESADRRRKFLFDMYLNTPDKALHETPLHFAAKFGRWDIVKLLYSIPLCDRHAKNKYGETASILAKNRGAVGIDSFRLDEDEERATSSYVGLYRDPDFAAPPVIRSPCLGFPPTTLDNSDVNNRTRSSPGLKSARLVAYAGPMSAETAKQFHSDWCSRKIAKANRGKEEKAVSAKRSDLHKGAERLGRALSTRYKIEWREFWPFLNKFCDLSSGEGLSAFEAFLRDRLSIDGFRLQADDLSRKLLALPSPFFDEFPRPSRKRPRKKLTFDKCDDDEAETFYDSLYDSSLADVVVDDDDLISGDENDAFSTPPETPPTVYISGSAPTKTDCEAFLALDNVEIDGDKFPLLRRWKDKIDLFSNEDRSSWPSFDSPRASRFTLASGH